MRRQLSLKCYLIQTITVSITVLILFNKYVEMAIIPPPWSDPIKNPCATLPGGWQLLYWPPLKKCFKIFQIGYPCPETMELSPAAASIFKQTDKNVPIAECKCPPEMAQSVLNNKCYLLFEQGPCNPGQYFSPVQDVPGRKITTTRWGICKTPKKCPDGMSFWVKDSKCYNTYTKGPCSKGKLIVSEDDGIAKCKCENSGELADYYYKAEKTCHEHYTRGPCKNTGELFLPGGKCDCNNQLPHYYNITGQCYELDTIGPCPPGHNYIVPDDNNKDNIKQAKCQCKDGYVAWPDGLCYRLYTRGPCDFDEFLINGTTCVKNFCGKGRLYFPDQKTCYRLGSQGPCALNQVVIFDFTVRPSIDGISFNGMCGCSGVIKNLDQQCTITEPNTQINRCESSPGMVELNGNCYKLYTRGPCGPGQWLEPVKPDNQSIAKITNKAKCNCRSDYESYVGQDGVIGCYAPSVGLARYLNGQNYNRTYTFQFRRFNSSVMR